MQTITVLLIILAAVAAMLIVLFQYYYKSKTKGRQRLLLSFLRLIALFSTFLLLVNPKFTKKYFSLEKANLLVLTDNSSSILNSGAQAQVDSILRALNASNQLANKFNIEKYRFGSSIHILDSLSFSENTTDIAKALKGLNTIHGNMENAVILLTDGNSTLGEDYEFYGKNQKFPIYPVVLGDTTSYDDLKITQVNTNKYAFLKNRFPVEMFVSYDGNEVINTRLNITMDGKNVYSQKMELTKNTNSKVVNLNLTASTIGLKTIRFSLDPLPNEKNVENNVKIVSIEVIDEKSTIVIVSDMLHPDLGALKKSIESNEQRSVTIVKPTVDLKTMDGADLFILYQPNTSYNRVYDYIEKVRVNTFTITGPKTDWVFLNTMQKFFTKNSYGQTEEVTAVVHNGFSKFDVSKYILDGYPPLESNLGEVIINKDHEVLLGQKIKGVDIGEPLLVLTGSDLEREAILFGENIWKWRAQDFRDHLNFNDFDELMGKIVLYLSTNESRSRLVLDYESIFEGNNEVKIGANYFDETFSFDPDAKITLFLKRKEEKDTKEFPMLLKGSYYETDLSNLPAGEYSFTVKVDSEGVSKSGSFNILDFDVEQQFTSSNYKKLGRLAESTNGVLYYPFNVQELISNLLIGDKFKPVQKSHENVVSLVDFRFLLAIIVGALSIEWFIRKFNGLT